MESLLFALNAVFPLILLSAFGFYLRQNGSISDTFLKEGSRFCFRYGFYAMMFTTVYKIESFEQIHWDVVGMMTAAVLLLFFIGLVAVILFIPDNRQKGVVHQAFYRSNFATIGIPLAYNMCGDEGLAAAALISAFSVPLYNTLAVISLSVFTRHKQKHPVRYVLRQIATNPLILGVFSGLICLAVRPYTGGYRLSTGNLRFIYKAIDALGGIAPWLSLIILGGQFKFSAIHRLLPQIALCTVTRLFLAPVLAMLLVIFGPHMAGIRPFSSAEYAALFALFATPQAVASVAMADQMGSDAELAGQVLVWTTFFSAGSIFVLAALLHRTGIL